MLAEIPSPNAESTRRIRRLLRVLRSIAAHMAADQREPNAAALHLAGRIGAIGRVALTAQPVGVDLESLVRDELCAHVVHRTGINISGPEILLNANSAPLLSLAVHELTTNAVKFGALSQPGTRLSVTWSLEGPSGSTQLRLEWREEGVRMHEGGRSAGFGADLLHRLIASELRGDGKMLFLGTGVRCTIAIPTSEALHPHE